MSNSVRHDFHSALAVSISDEIQFQKANYYYFLGKVEPWGNVDASPSVMQADSDQENKIIRSNALYVKKITANDVSIVTKRNDWVTGTVFVIWDHTQNLRGENFYCVTDENTVFKCLDNNGGVPSTVKPSEKSFSVFRTSDGYLWKYMYTIPSFKRSRFTTFDYIPVQRALSNSFYNKGSVDHVSVIDGGSGYTDVLLTTIAVTGTTTGTGAAGTVTVGPLGQITGINLSNGGTGYTKGVKISVNSITGSGAVGTATIVAGVVTNVTFSSAGINYTAGDSIVFAVGGAQCVAAVSRVTGSITDVIIINSGAGYTVNPTIGVSGAGGVGKYGNAFAVLKGFEFNGELVGVTIEDPGIGYPADANTSILVQGDGAGAVFSPIINAGKVIDVVIENPGTGYTSLSLTVVSGGGGSGAKLNSIITASDFTSDQSIVEQTTVEGAIYSVVVTVPGNNYSLGTTVSIVGDGSGATATLTFASGGIAGVKMVSYGSNYTYADIIFNDPNRGLVGTVVDAVAYAALPPTGGHGYDAISELYGDTLAINSSLRQDDKVNTIIQDYRQFGLLKNPTNITTGKLVTENSSLLTHEALFVSTVGLVLDEILLLNNIKFRVVYVAGQKVTLQQLGINFAAPVGTLSAANEPSRFYSSTTVTTFPTVNKYSGSLLYVSNENPFSFSAEQGLVIKTFLKF